MRHLPARSEQTQSPVSSDALDALRAAKLAAQERLAAARRKLSSAQSEFQKASKAERVAVLEFVDAYDSTLGAHHG